ncbi:hypothetical protein ABPG75_005294 [Micractinium tetrahymenae]
MGTPVAAAAMLADQLARQLLTVSRSMPESLALHQLWQQLEAVLDALPGAFPPQLASALAALAAVVGQLGTPAAASQATAARRAGECTAAASHLMLAMDVGTTLLAHAKTGRLQAGDADMVRLLSAARLSTGAGTALLQDAGTLRLLAEHGNYALLSECIKVAHSIQRPVSARVVAASRALEPQAVLAFLEAAAAATERRVDKEGARSVDLHLLELLTNVLVLVGMLPTQQLLVASNRALCERLARLVCRAIGARAKMPSNHAALLDWASTVSVAVGIMSCTCLEGGRRALARAEEGRVVLGAAARLFKSVPLTGDAYLHPGTGPQQVVMLGRLSLQLGNLAALLLDDVVAGHLGIAAPQATAPGGNGALLSAEQLRCLAHAAKQLRRLLAATAAAAPGVGQLAGTALLEDLRNLLVCWSSLCHNLRAALLTGSNLELETPAACASTLASAEALLRVEPSLRGQPAFGPVPGRAPTLLWRRTVMRLQPRSAACASPLRRGCWPRCETAHHAGP